MPYGEDITINVGDTVRIHPKYENYKFKKLKHDVVYRVDEVDEIRIKSLVGILSGDTIHLNMDKSYFEHVGKEEKVERNYNLEIGDVVLITEGGWGFCPEDEDKYVEVVGFGEYLDGDPGVIVKPYNDTKLCTESSRWTWMCGYESFGSSPLILLNTKEEYSTKPEDESHIKVAEGSKEEVDKVLGINREQYTGGSSNYYKVYVKHPTTLPEPYEAECNDIIESLQMTFAEGNAFKAIWRKAKARQGVKKKGYDNGVYDSEKVVFFGERMLIEAKDSD